MGVRIEGYRPEYFAGVISCLQRNFEWMRKADAKEIERWIQPSISFRWREDVSSKQYPYKYGMVLLSDKVVVGFLGCIYSKRYVSGIPYIYLTGTNWCIDKEYRMYLIPILKKLYVTADVIGDFTPRKSVEEILTHIFKFQYVNTEKIRFTPIPFLDSHSISIYMVSPDEISDMTLSMEYKDNTYYGVKCVKFQSESEIGFVFYKVMNFNGKWIQIVKMVNGELFAKNAHEIVWCLQKLECYESDDNPIDDFCEIVRRVRKNEWVNLECEKSFLGEAEIRHPMFDSVPVVRLMLNKKKNEITPSMDFLYSEMVMLDLR